MSRKSKAVAPTIQQEEQQLQSGFRAALALGARG
jgi:hypothetical protein